MRIASSGGTVREVTAAEGDLGGEGGVNCCNIPDCCISSISTIKNWSSTWKPCRFSRKLHVGTGWGKQFSPA